MSTANMSYDVADTKKYKQAPEGTSTGICYMVADIGTQKTSFEGVEDQKRQVVIGWELPEELTDDGKPLSIIKTYTLSFNEKATLAKDYKAWLKESAPKSFNLGKLIGAGCNLGIGQTSGGNAKVINVTALKASEKIPPLSRGTILYDLRNPDENEYVKLPEFLKEKVAASPEYQSYCKKEAGIDEELSDEIPF